MKDYIALVTVELHKFARQIAGGGRRQRSLRRVEPMSEMACSRHLTRSWPRIESLDKGGGDERDD
jgi:hypothetical protein